MTGVWPNGYIDHILLTTELKMDKSQLQEVLEDILDENVYDFEIRSYSGRGMNGKNCLAIVTNENIWNIAIEVGVTCKLYGYDWADIPEPKQDHMGLSTVYYWPDIQYVKDDAHEPSNED